MWLFSTKIHQRRRQRRRLSIDSRREPRRGRDELFPQNGGHYLRFVVGCYKTERERNRYCSSTNRLTEGTLAARVILIVDLALCSLILIPHWIFQYSFKSKMRLYMLPCMVLVGPQTSHNNINSQPLPGSEVSAVVVARLWPDYVQQCSSSLVARSLPFRKLIF